MDVQGADEHGAVPSNQPASGLTKVRSRAVKPRGTGPPAGPPGTPAEAPGSPGPPAEPPAAEVGAPDAPLAPPLPPPEHATATDIVSAAVASQPETIHTRPRKSTIRPR